MSRTFSRRSVVLTALALPALAACSGGADVPGTSGSSASDGGSGAAADAFPVTVEHIYGTTEIAAEPTRIATVSWVNGDTVLALDIVPVGLPLVEWGGNDQQSTDWIDAKLDELGASWGSENAPTTYSETDGVNADEIAALTPDLIVAAYSGLTQEEYDTLAKIAPTIGPLAPSYTASWEDVLTAVGTATGRSARAEELAATLTADLAAVGEENPEVAESTFIAANLSPTDHAISIYAGDDTRPRFFTALGMTQADVVTENTPDDSTFYFEWSAERGDELVSDVLYTWASADTTIESLQADALFDKIPAVASGALVLTADDHQTLSISAASVLSLPWALENVVPSVVEAARTAKA
ncbi:ABC transporter substrate-binding protein [Brachybacterium aquaticum]|uniref:Iron complex transport system substrate-binding protein n=1 Tax=Brachybacterium aquaticum TaxID=1432564 RepID=A0A841AAV9_9MICO|nr:ABC transporter substrate-binding protein [Brachybacterium aquaticum]MBB5830370.1 iron complex transport system substrate-binding protein [Brachybacterium aquaticum]